MSGQIILVASIKHSKATLSKKKKIPLRSFLSESVCLLEKSSPAERTLRDVSQHGEKSCNHMQPKQQRKFKFFNICGWRGGENISCRNTWCLFFWSHHIPPSGSVRTHLREGTTRKEMKHWVLLMCCN